MPHRPTIAGQTPDAHGGLSKKRLTHLAALLGASVVLAIPATSAPARTNVARPITGDAFPPGETASGNYLAAIVAGSKQDIAPAAQYYNEALKTDRRNSEILERGFLAHLADGNMPAAFRYAQIMISADGKAALPNLALAVRSMQMKQFDKAKGHLALASGKYRNSDPTANLLTAWTEVGSGRIGKALALADQVNEPALVNLRNYLSGLMADVAGKKDEALKRLKAAYQAEPTNSVFADAYASVEARVGDRAVAQKLYEDALALAPNEPQLKQRVADMKAGKVPEPPISSSVEGAAKVFYLLGGARARPGEEILPLIYMQFAHFLVPKDDTIAYALGDSFGAVGQSERAIGYFDLVSPDSPLRDRAMIKKAFNLETAGNTEEAIKTLNVLLKDGKAELDALNSLGVLLRVKKRWPEAIEVYSKAIQQIGSPTAADWSLFHGRGICYERNKQWPEAEADLKTALSFLPDNPRLGPVNAYSRAQVLNYLAYSWVDRDLHIDEAFPMLQRAVDLTGARDGYIVDSLGWAYYRQGKYDQAVVELERALALKSSDPVINDHLGDAYWKVGRKLEAQFQWNHARDLKPEPEDLAVILKKIENGFDEVRPAAAENSTKPNGG